MPYTSDLGIVREYNERYEEAYYAWNPLFPEAETDLDFFLGNQWDDKEKRALFEEGRNAYVFNRVRRVINMITGYQRKHRLSSVILPFEDSDQKTADQMTKLVMHIFNRGNAYQVISDAFGGACKTGWNLINLAMDYRDDPINGDIVFNREPFNGFICDPFFSKLDFSDCDYILRRKYLSMNHVVSLFPKHEKMLREIHSFGWERDDKFTWLPYQREVSGQDLMAVDEMSVQKWEPVKFAVNMKTGEMFEWEGDQEQFKIFMSLNPYFQLITRQRRYIERTIIVNDHVIERKYNPYGLDEYDCVPVVALFEPESDKYGLKIQSVVRAIRDPQREANKRRSQMIDLLDSQINSGYIADENSVINPRSLFQSSQGKVIWRKADAKPGAIEKIPPAQIPPSMFQLQQQFDQDISEIAGANDAAFGMMESGNESGVLQMLRQGAALTNIQDLFDNLRFSQKMLTIKTIKMAQQWSPEKIQRIIGEQPTEEFFDPSFTKYDCSVQEGVLTETQKQMYFRQLVELQQLGAPVSGEMLAKAAPIQGKTEYIQEVAQLEQQQAQAAQQQQQIQQQLIEAQTNLATSRSLEQVAGAKERFTRAVANLGLEDERSSEAIQNRTQAVLDQSRAIKELQDMDLKRAQDELTLVAMLREQNRQEEEQIKADNVMISEAAGQPPAAQPQQTVEVPNG